MTKIEDLDRDIRRAERIGKIIATLGWSAIVIGAWDLAGPGGALLAAGLPAFVFGVVVLRAASEIGAETGARDRAAQTKYPWDRKS